MKRKGASHMDGNIGKKKGAGHMNRNISKKKGASHMNKNIIIKKGILVSAMAAICLFQAKAEKANAASEPAIANNEAVVYLDNTDQISVQGEGIQSVSYSSSKKKIATISQKGKITPKKKGTTTIQAKVTYQTGGQNHQKTISYQLKILGKSEEYFEFTKDRSSYRNTSDPAVITGLTVAGRKLNTLYIPERYRGKKITKIDFGAFSEGSSMERVYISDYVRYLDYWSDYEGENSWNTGCFDKGCSKLKEIHLGKNVETFGTSTNLPNLEKITVAPGNSTFHVRDGVLFGKRNSNSSFAAKNTLICYPAKKKDTSYTIPDGITDIAGGAFAWAKSLEQVHFPKGIKEINDQAFAYTGLKEVVLPDGIQYLYSAFAECSHLAKAVIPKISDAEGGIASSFKNCRNLNTVIMENLPKGFSNAFSGCGNLEELQLPADLKGIVQKEGVIFDSSMQTLLFYPAGKKDKSYQLPAGIKKVGESAFAGTQHLLSVTMNKDLQIIEEYAFRDARIENIHLNEGLKEICGSAFDGSDILELRLPDNCKISSSICMDCKKLRSVKFPANLEKLTFGFQGCSSLRTLHISKKIKKLGGGFYLKGCTSLTSITVEQGNQYFTAVNGVLYSKSKKTLIAYPPAKKGKKFSVPKTVKKIGANALIDSRFLQEISMKDSVTACGQNAFSGGAALKKVRLSKNLKKIEYGLFSHCRKLQKITIPDKVKQIEYGAFDGCTSLKSVTLGKKVKKICENAFRDCHKLQKITLRKKTWARNLTLEKCFVRTGSKNYRKLVLKLPKKWKKDKKLVMYEFHDGGLSKKAKVAYY